MLGSMTLGQWAFVWETLYQIAFGQLTLDLQAFNQHIRLTQLWSHHFVNSHLSVSTKCPSAKWYSTKRRGAVSRNPDLQFPAVFGAIRVLSIRFWRGNSLQKFFPATNEFHLSGKNENDRQVLSPDGTNQGITVDLLFDWFGLVCFANKNKNYQFSYSWFQTSQTGGQWYSDTSPFVFPAPTDLIVLPRYQKLYKLENHFQ